MPAIFPRTRRREFLSTSPPGRGISTSRSTASPRSDPGGSSPCSRFSSRVHPKPDQWDAYLGYAKMLRPELERIDGFVDNIRYKSLTRDGWVLSLSNWRDEKAVVRWRTTVRHHEVQEKGRAEVFLDYHLRVGQLTHD